MEKNYTVEVYVSECQTDTFTIKAEDLETAKRDAMAEAVRRGYSIDDVIDVIQEREDKKITEKRYIIMRTSWQYYDAPEHPDSYSSDVLIFAEREEDGKINGMGDFYDCESGSWHNMTYYDFLEEDTILFQSDDYQACKDKFKEIVHDFIKADCE